MAQTTPEMPFRAEDLARFAAKPKTQQRTENIAQQVQENVKKSLRLVTPERFFAVLILVVLAILMVNGQMRLTSLASEITDRQADIKTLESEYTALDKRRMDLFSAANIEYYATEVLGMVKMDFTNVEYVEITNPDSIEVTDKGIFGMNTKK